MNYYIAIGIPAGQIYNDSTPSFIYKGHLMTMADAPYRVWCEFLRISSLENVAEQIGKNIENIKSIFDQLLQARLVISVEEIMSCTPQRCGIGLGYNSETQDYLIRSGENIHIPLASYLIWCGSNSKNTFSDIVNDLRSKEVIVNDSTAHKAVHTLIRRGVVNLCE